VLLESVTDEVIWLYANSSPLLTEIHVPGDPATVQIHNTLLLSSQWSPRT